MPHSIKIGNQEIIQNFINADLIAGEQTPS